MTSLSVIHISKDDTQHAQSIWNTLHQKDQHSFFTSWEWISTWINSLPNTVDIRMLVCYKDKHPVFAAMICIAKTDEFAKRVNHKSAFVNETGIHEFDDIVIEQNSFIGKLQHFQEYADVPALLKALKCNKLIIKAAHPDFYQAFKQASSKCKLTVLERANDSHFVSLHQVRESGNYLSLLSRNKRAQIKRSLDLYKTGGELSIKPATDTEHALSLYDELIELHQKEWQRRGSDGAFSNPFIHSFHRKLITQYFTTGKLGLYKISNAEKTIGLIYGFLSHQDFLYYQSGFNYSEDNKDKPGLSCHSLLIEELARQNLNRYDFLAGNSVYKKSLGTDSYKMYYLEVLDHSFKSWVYLALKTLKTHLREIKQKARTKHRGRPPAQLFRNQAAPE